MSPCERDALGRGQYIEMNARDNVFTLFTTERRVVVNMYSIPNDSDLDGKDLGMRPTISLPCTNEDMIGKFIKGYITRM